MSRALERCFAARLLLLREALDCTGAADKGALRLRDNDEDGLDTDIVLLLADDVLELAREDELEEDEDETTVADEVAGTLLP